MLIYDSESIEPVQLIIYISCYPFLTLFGYGDIVASYFCFGMKFSRSISISISNSTQCAKYNVENLRNVPFHFSCLFFALSICCVYGILYTLQIQTTLNSLAAYAANNRWSSRISNFVNLLSGYGRVLD